MINGSRRNKEKILKYPKQVIMKTHNPNIMTTAKAVLSSKKEIYSNTVLPQEKQEISNKPCILTPKSN